MPHHTVVPDDETAHLPAMPAPELEPRRCEAAAAEGPGGEGVEQTAGHMEHGAGEAEHPVVIDQREGRSWNEKTFRRRRPKGGVRVEVRGMQGSAPHPRPEPPDAPPPVASAGVGGKP